MRRCGAVCCRWHVAVLAVLFAWSLMSFFCLDLKLISTCVVLARSTVDSSSPFLLLDSSFCLCTYLCIYVSMYLCIYVSMYLSIYVSMYLCIYLSIYLAIYLIYLSNYVEVSNGLHPLCSSSLLVENYSKTVGNSFKLTPTCNTHVW